MQSKTNSCFKMCAPVLMCESQPNRIINSVSKHTVLFWLKSDLSKLNLDMFIDRKDCRKQPVNGFKSLTYTY